MSNKYDVESEEMVAPDVVATEEKPKRTKKNGENRYEKHKVES